MTDFREFSLLLRYPPNPIRDLANQSAHRRPE